MEIKGTIYKLGDPQVISEKFKKQDIVIEEENERNPEWNNFYQIAFTQDRIDLLKNLKVGAEVTVHVNLRGRKWTPKDGGEERFFTSLDGWRIETAEEEPPVNMPTAPVDTGAEVDDLPF